MKTSNGINIKSQSDHFLERVFGTMADPTHLDASGKPLSRSGVAIDDIINTLKNGNAKKSSKDLLSVSFATQKYSVSVNPSTGNLIQVNSK